MKILILIHKLYGGGAERVATILANHLCQKHDVTIVVNANNLPPFPIDNRVKIVTIPYKIKIRYTFTIQTFMFVSRMIKKENTDLIISFLIGKNIQTILLNLFTKKKLIISERTSTLRNKPMWRLARKYLYPLASHVVYVSQCDYEYHSHIKNKSAIHNPAILEPYSNYSNRSKSILAVGALYRWKIKGYDMLLKAWYNLANKYPDWTLEILGKTSPNPIEKKIKKYNLQGRIKFLDYTTKPEDIYRDKSIFVLTSRFEGCPNSLIEAMSQGCACLANNCPSGPHEIINNGIDGLLSEYNNVEDFTNKLALLIEDYELRKRLSSEATKITQKFNKEAIMQKWDDVIASVCSE